MTKGNACHCNAHGGGYVVATGTPEEVAQVEGSYTGQYLKHYL